MNWFKNLRVGAKLGWAFAAVIAVTITVGIVAMWDFQQLRSVSQELVSDWLPSVQHLSEIKADTLQARKQIVVQIVCHTNRPNHCLSLTNCTLQHPHPSTRNPVASTHSTF